MREISTKQLNRWQEFKERRSVIVNKYIKALKIKKCAEFFNKIYVLNVIIKKF
jgi:hypothetical protein